LKNQSKSSILKTIMILFCAVTLLSSGVFYYSNGMGNESEIVSKSIKPVLNQNEQKRIIILQELKDLKRTYDGIIIENKALSLELIQERDKVIKLMSDLEASAEKQISLKKYMSQIKMLQDKVGMMIVENEKLKMKNALITEQRDSAKIILNQSQKRNESLKLDLQNTVDKFSKLLISGTSITTFKLKSSGEQVVTDKAKRVDGINITFLIAKNELVKPTEKVYYIQVVNGENVVLGGVNEGTHKYMSLTYSLAAKVKYENKMIKISQNLYGNDLVKGTYYVNIYDKEVLIDESVFTLK
jgi:regulator of replication initiation timing